MNPPAEIARPSTFTNAQTILYEIDMVRFAAGNFGNPDGWGSWSNLECFLLHFRNLIEFFGKQPRGDGQECPTLLADCSAENGPRIRVLHLGVTQWTS